jgi:hypothetical protein
MDLWEEIQAFLKSNPAPGKGKRFRIGEVRFTMGMHRYYLDGQIQADAALDQRIDEIVEKYNLRLDERDARNYVVFDQGNEYIGRIQDSRLILMPQKISPELFQVLVGLYTSY